MRRFLLCVSFLLVLCSASAQTAGPVRGVVVDAVTETALPDVSVTNLVTGQTILTDEGGRFTLSALPGQDFGFTLIGYDLLKRTAPMVGTGLLRIKLRPNGARLDEVVVRPDYTPYQRDSARRAATYKRALSRQRSSVMSPASFILERTAKRQRRLFRFQKEFYQMETERFIESRYNADLVQSLTGLSGDTLAGFLNTHPIPLEFVQEATDLEIKAWVRAAWKAWVAKGSPLPTPVAEVMAVKPE